MNGRHAPLRVTGRNHLRNVPVLLIVAVLACWIAVAACGRSGSTERGSARTPAHEFVVPDGTYDAILRNEKVTVMPDELRLRVGDLVVIRNEDRYDQTVGPYFVKAGGRLELRYGTPGVFESTCTVSGSGKLVVVVEK